MRKLIHAELLKLHTTRGFWAYVVAALAFVPVSIALAVSTAGTEGSPAPALETSEGVRNVIAAASSGGILLLLIGILIMAGEFRHSTATATFLISPNRKRVVAAKLAAASLVGVGVAAAASLLTLAVALPWLAAKDVDVSLLSSDVGVPLLGALLGTTIAPMVGIGLGALVRNQTVAVTVALVWVIAVEALLVGYKPEIGRWLPGGASSALTGTATAEGGLLPIWAAALLFAGYGLAFAVAGTRFVLRRDIA